MTLFRKQAGQLMSQNNNLVGGISGSFIAQRGVEKVRK